MATDRTDRQIEISAELKAFLLRTESKAAQEGISTDFNAPIVPTVKSSDG